MCKQCVWKNRHTKKACNDAIQQHNDVILNVISSPICILALFIEDRWSRSVSSEIVLGTLWFANWLSRALVMKMGDCWTLSGHKGLSLASWVCELAPGSMAAGLWKAGSLWTLESLSLTRCEVESSRKIDGDLRTLKLLFIIGKGVLILEQHKWVTSMDLYSWESLV